MNDLDPVKNFAEVTVSTGYDSAAVTVALAAGEGAKFPAPATDGAFNVTWWDSHNYLRPDLDPLVEIVRVTARSTDTLTVTRAQESTSATNKNTASGTYKMILGTTAKTITDIDTKFGKTAGTPVAASPYAVLSTDKVINVTAASAITVNLPASLGTGRMLTIKNLPASTYNVTVVADVTGTADKIDDAASQTLYPGDSMTIHDAIADKWYII